MSEQTDNSPTPAIHIREIRINPVVPSESVLVATARGMRPKKEEASVQHDTRPYLETCPFCRGNEAMTPAPVIEVPAVGEWELRVVEPLSGARQ